MKEKSQSGLKPIQSSIGTINKLILAGETAEALKLLNDSQELLPSIIIRQKLDEISKNSRHAIGSDSPQIGTAGDMRQLEGCLLDISDLLNFLLAGHSTLSGIQRLIVATLCELNREERQKNTLVTFHDFSTDGGRIVTWEAFDLIVELVSGRISDKVFHQAFRLAVENLPLLEAETDQSNKSTLLIMGACWIVPDFPYAQKSVARKLGLKIVSILYDLIPFSRPEYVSADGVSEFYMYIVSLLSISSKVITISRHVERELKKSTSFFQIHVPVMPDIEAVPLARQIPLPSADKEDRSSEADVKKRLKGLGIFEDFVLCVGSIEIRKNHIGLFVAWRKLFGMLGKKCPLLVIVGRKGWKAEAFFDSLNATNSLDQKILVLNGLGDNDLARLYSECLFSVYPSLDEGWGLPIGESLDSGKVCVTSDLASMPEVGEDLCLYVNPHDPNDIAAKCLQLIQSDQELKEMEFNIHNAKPFNSWHDYKNDLARSIETAKASLEIGRDLIISNVLIRLAEPVCFYWHLGYPLLEHPCALKETKRSLSLIVPSKIARDSGALRAEHDGTWISEDRLILSFVLGLESEVSRDLHFEDDPTCRRFEFLIHFSARPGFCNNWQPVCEVSHGSLLRLLKAEDLQPVSYIQNTSRPEVYLKAPDLLSITTDFWLARKQEQALADCVQMTDQSDRLYLPVRFSLFGVCGTPVEASGDNPRHDNFKIKEFAIFSV
jgi:glycosyltransferase involved in cell wall biosynthesis